MRSYNSNTLEALNDGTDLVVRWLLLVTAKTFDTVPESATLALWNEVYNQSFTVGGSSYQFYGAGSLISPSIDTTATVRASSPIEPSARCTSTYESSSADVASPS